MLYVYKSLCQIEHQIRFQSIVYTYNIYAIISQVTSLHSDFFGMRINLEFIDSNCVIFGIHVTWDIHIERDYCYYFTKFLQICNEKIRF